MMARRIFLVFCLVAAAHTTVSAQHTFNTAKLDTFLESLHEHKRAMGSLSISENGVIRYSKSFGYLGSNPAGKAIPSNAETRYHIGSITKTFTAVMILQLVEEGKLKLNTPLSGFFPKVPNTTK